MNDADRALLKRQKDAKQAEAEERARAVERIAAEHRRLEPQAKELIKEALRLLSDRGYPGGVLLWYPTPPTWWSGTKREPVKKAAWVIGTYRSDDPLASADEKVFLVSDGYLADGGTWAPSRIEASERHVVWLGEFINGLERGDLPG